MIMGFLHGKTRAKELVTDITVARTADLDEKRITVRLPP